MYSAKTFGPQHYEPYIKRRHTAEMVKLSASYACKYSIVEYAHDRSHGRNQVTSIYDFSRPRRKTLLAIFSP